MIGVGLCMVLTASPSLAAAKQHLEKGELEAVAADFVGQRLDATDATEASRTLAAASKAALNKGDAVLAYGCAQKATELTPDEPLALEAAARAAAALDQLAEAERYADAWLAVAPESVAAQGLRLALRERAEAALRVTHAVPERILYCDGSSAACDSARGLLAGGTRPFVVKDVRADAQAAKELSRTCPEVTGYPAVYLDGRWLFGEQALREALRPAPLRMSGSLHRGHVRIGR